MAKPTVVAIDAISDPILSKPDLPEAMREVLRSLSARVAAGSNWRVRKKTLIDVVEGLDAVLALDEAEALEGIEDFEVPDEATHGTAANDTAANDSATDETAANDDSPVHATDDPGELDVPEFDVVDVLPAYVGAILESLDEKTIVGVEQAACYILSAHPEHQKAGWDWIDADHVNFRAFKKLLRADRRYAFYYDEIEAQATAADGTVDTPADGDDPDGAPPPTP